MAMEGDVMDARMRGFTLVEQMLVVAISAVLLVVALPALGPLVERHRAGTAMSTLSTQMQLTRMAAITYRRPAVLCPSHNGSACDGGTDWSIGWLVFLDVDGNQQPDSADQILRVEPGTAARSGMRLVGTVGRPRLRYLPDGRSAGSNLTVSVCSAEGALLGAVIVNNVGRPRSFRPASPAACPG